MGAPSSRAGRAPGSTRPSSCATAGSATGARACSTPSATSTARSPTSWWAWSPPTSGSSTTSWSPSTAPTASPASAPTPSSACRSRWRRRRPTRRGSRSTATSAAPTRTCCRCRSSTCSTAGRTPTATSTSRSSCSRPSARRASAKRCAGAPRPTTRSETRLHDRGLSTALGDEGGFAPNLPSNEEALALLLGAIEAAGYTPGDEIALALDTAASEFYNDGRYVLAGEGADYSSAEWADRLVTLCDRYPIVSIEDGMAEDDWDGWLALTRAARRARAARGRRPLRHQRRPDPGRHRPRGRQLGAHQGQPDRHALGDARRDAARELARLHADDVAPQRRHRRHHDRRPRGGHELRADQERRTRAQRTCREVQPAPADRGGAGPGGRLPSGVPRWRPEAPVAERAEADAEAAPRGRSRAGAKPAKRAGAKRGARRRPARRRPTKKRKPPSGRARPPCARRSAAWCSSACSSRSCTRRARSSTSAPTPTRHARSSSSCARRTSGSREETKKLQSDSEIERRGRAVRARDAGERPFVIIPAPTDHACPARNAESSPVDCGRWSPPTTTSPSSPRCSAARRVPTSPSSSAAPPVRAVVIRNEPLTHDGTPMPTRYWLVDRALSVSVSRLESAGGVRAAEAAVDPEALQAAHDAYAAERDAAHPRGPAGPASARWRGRHPQRREVPPRPLRRVPRRRHRPRRRMGRPPRCQPASADGSLPRLLTQERGGAVTRVAAVDIGTNSTRLLVADVDGTGRDAKLRPLDRRMRITRLGQGVDRTRALAPEAIDAHRRRAARVPQPRSTSTASNASRATATSAARDATNRDDFFAPALDVLGVTPELLSGDEEAALSFLGATADLDAPAPYLVVDIGGGSTEFVLGTDDARRAWCRSTSGACASPSSSSPPTRPRPRSSPNAVATVRDLIADVPRARPGCHRGGDARRPRRHHHHRRRDRARPARVRPRAHPPLPS